MQNRLFCASLLLAGLALPGHAQLVFQAPDPIALHAGSGEVTFTLSNRGSTAVTDLKLTHGPIVDSATHTAINGAAVALTTDCKNTNLPTNIDPGTTLSLLANLTGISGTSQAEFPILNGTLPLGHSQARSPATPRSFEPPIPSPSTVAAEKLHSTLSNQGTTAVTDLKLTHGPIVDSATHTAINGAAVATVPLTAKTLTFRPTLTRARRSHFSQI